jgi:hypothetical protein
MKMSFSTSDLGSSSLSSLGSSAAPRSTLLLSSTYKTTSAAAGNPRSSASLPQTLNPSLFFPVH